MTDRTVTHDDLDHFVVDNNLPLLWREGLIWSSFGVRVFRRMSVPRCGLLPLALDGTDGLVHMFLSKERWVSGFLGLRGFRSAGSSQLNITTTVVVLQVSWK